MSEKNPFSENALEVLKRRYLKKLPNGELEEPIDLFRRVARDIALADLDYGATGEEISKTANEFFNLMWSKDFLPNSPTLMNAGRDLQMLSACFVLPVDDSIEGIFTTLKHQAIIHQGGGGTGFSFSRLRPKGGKVKSTDGVASGPISFMRIFNTATDVIKQGGKRRGANMSVLRVDHPDVIEFIKLKENMDEMRNFNISVAITSKFMDALSKNEDYDLINPQDGVVVGQLNSKFVFDLLVHHAWLTGDPGVIFIDRINETNPANHVETIESCNPCGEQNLSAYDSCNLGSINISNFTKASHEDDPICKIDFDRLRGVVEQCVHFLDNIIDRNKYPIEEIKDKTRSNRRIGLGVMGFADLLIQLGVPYDSDEGLEIGSLIMEEIHLTAKKASSKLADKRGNFPNWPGSQYEKYDRPMRNVAVDTVAPTGTISMIADCSSGIEPLFGVAFVKTVMDGTSLTYAHPEFEAVSKVYGWWSQELMDKIAHEGSVQKFKEIPENWRRVFVTAQDISPEYHVKMQAAFQEHVDNAISKTINFSKDATEDQVREAYLLAWETGCKGITVFRDGCRDEQVLTTGKTELTVSGKDKVGTQHREPKKRPYQMKGSTYKVPTPYGNMYVTINDDEDGKPFEVFATLGKSGGFFSSQSEAVCRLISLSLRSGIPMDEVVDQLKGIRGPDVMWHQGGQLLSLPDAIGRVLMNHGGKGELKQGSVANDGRAPACPDCGSGVEFSEGCIKCRGCGYSACG